MFLGLRTVIYPAPDLQAMKAWFAALLGIDPYFDQPFYVGFEVGGYELGLDPSADPAAGPVSYWGVVDAHAAWGHLLAAGATPHTEGLQDVGDGILVGAVREPTGNIVGIIENPHFQASPATSTA